MNFSFMKPSILVSTLIAVVVLLVAACGPADTPAPTPADNPPATQPAATDTPVAEEAEAATTGDEAEEPAGSEAAPPPAAVSEGAASELEPAARADMYSEVPPMQIDPSTIYYATLKTEQGDIKAQLFADRAPVTVNNFVFLAREGFYNNTTFHRVLDGFMAQGGDPTGTGAGGPGYRFQDEIDPSLTFDRAGLLAMANSGPATNGSQFFITFAPTEWLNGNHTIFGEIVEGAEVLDKLTRRDPTTNPSFEGDLLYTVLIEESETSLLPTPLPPTPTPTPFAPTGAEADERLLATVEPAQRANYYNTAPELAIDTTRQYTATIATTQGEMVIELYADAAPVAVNNFVVLSNLGFFDGLPINQNSPDNALIFGSPDNNPQHDVGYRIQAETNLTHTLEVGSVAYIPFQLPTGELVASGSQLLVARIVPPATANAQFSFFGRIIDGLEVLDALTTEDTIESVTVHESE
ncbi:MAG: hypothetical protein DCC55_13350 [Chloroflexi bacterium]|nr:MAG: hypothetical protein DCC55_13350 [Chloroflexota bacterium]